MCGCRRDYISTIPIFELEEVTEEEVNCISAWTATQNKFFFKNHKMLCFRLGHCRVFLIKDFPFGCSTQATTIKTCINGRKCMKVLL